MRDHKLCIDSLTPNYDYYSGRCTYSVEQFPVLQYSLLTAYLIVFFAIAIISKKPLRSVIWPALLILKIFKKQ